MDNIKGFALRFDKELCTQCGICEGSCAYGAIRLVDSPEIDVDACRLCGDCTRSCPAGALTFDTPYTAMLHAKFSARREPELFILGVCATECRLYEDLGDVGS